MTSLRITLAQLNLTVGDINGNLQKIMNAATEARDKHQSDLIVYPELCLTGYPPEDLLLRKAFLEDEQTALQQFIKTIKNIYCVVSHTASSPHGLQNACSIIYNGNILGTYAKQHLPNYGVFDEKRYFSRGQDALVVPIKDVPVGIIVCEDLWVAKPAEQAAAAGAKLLLSPNASPFEVGKHEKRANMLSKRAEQTKTVIAYINNVGGQDDLVFDGGSMIVDAAGNLCQCAGFFNESLMTTTLQIDASKISIPVTPFKTPSTEENIYQALVTGVRDYVNKNHFSSVILGLSGGIDSALTLAIAVDALGRERVHTLILPSRHTASISIDDAEQIAKTMQVSHQTISIEPTYKAFLETLKTYFAGKPADLTEQNLQSRCRGTLLMAASNKFGHLVLTTGNRSELAMGYSTLYGDMAGGFDVLKDIYKTMVYRLAAYRNQISPVIPQRVIDRAPTAELADDQKDEDTLPPYAVLDPILEAYLNKQMGMDEIVALGFDKETVARVINTIRINEYKRRQSPLGPRIQHTAFGKDRRYPVTNGFKR
jgi:NAD+ synthase (glutamine-hydrolysing)